MPLKCLKENFNIVLEICNSIIPANTPPHKIILTFSTKPSFVTITITRSEVYPIEECKSHL